MERYEILKDIGSGNFGVAKLVRDKWSGELYAIKYIERGLKVLYLCLPSISILLLDFSIQTVTCCFQNLQNLIWVVCLRLLFHLRCVSFQMDFGVTN